MLSQLLFYLIRNKSCFFFFLFIASACFRPGWQIVWCGTSLLDILSALMNLMPRRAFLSRPVVGGEGPSLSGPPDLLSNEVAVCQQVGSLIRSHRSQRSTHTVKWAEVVYFFSPSESMSSGRLDADTDTVTVQPCVLCRTLSL